MIKSQFHSFLTFLHPENMKGPGEKEEELRFLKRYNWREVWCIVDLYLGICIISLASGFMKEISVSLLGDPEMCSSQLGEDLEDAWGC